MQTKGRNGGGLGNKANLVGVHYDIKGVKGDVKGVKGDIKEVKGDTRLLPIQKKQPVWPGAPSPSLTIVSYPGSSPFFCTRRIEPGYEASLTTPGYKLNLHVGKFFVESL